MQPHLPNPPAARRGPAWAGILILLALFGGLCTAFAGVFTVHDWVLDQRHARWPVTTATVRASGIDLEHPFSRDGGGTVYHVTATTWLDLGRDTATARIYSESVRQTGGTPVMRQWVEQHPPGTALRVRYDPGDPHHAELVDAGGLMLPRHPRQDLVLVLVCAVLSGLLYRAGRMLRRAGDAE